MTVVTSQHLALKVLSVMYVTRFMDEKCFKLSRQNKGGTFQLSVAGHELIGAVAALQLEPGRDWGLPYYRDRAFALGLGASPMELFGTFLGRLTAHHSGGRMMPEHFSHRGLKIPCQSSCVGSQFLQAVGVAKGLQFTDTGEETHPCVYVSGGEGSTSQGDFHEAINFSCLHRLGVIFVIQDNDWAISVPRHEQIAGGSIASWARGYTGLSVFEVDGCDYEASSEALAQATLKARRAEGPTLIIASVPRIGPHSNSDDPSKYQDAACIAAAKGRDPIPRLEQWIIAQGLASLQEIEEMKKAALTEVEYAAMEAEQLPFPDPSTVTDNLFLPTPVTEEQRPSCPVPREPVVMVDALNHALDEEMARTPGIVVFGEDVAHGKGGVFGVTRGLTAKYGTHRCFNTPLAESTIIGVALGMSFVDGVIPVAEIQFADYVWPGMNQLVNELASVCYRSNGEWNCPVVIRMPYGGYIQGGPYHSQSIEAFLAHAPGLKVVIPSHAADAKRLLKAAMRDPNPVVFLEHKALYRQRLFCARPEPREEEILPLGKAAVVREGTDLTVVGWGMTVCMAAELADALARDGIAMEIIDLRTIVPLDIETVLNSVRKTGKLLIAHEAPRSGGFGAEIAARIGEAAFAFLDAPIQRLGGKECPVPYSKGLEDAVLPQKADLDEAIRFLAAY
jgi:2-oxoisovalerate dehydrogenase E1 component